MKRILFVEDDPQMRVIIRLLMTGLAADWETVLAEDAKHGLDLLFRNPFDAVVSDLVMPGMDGYDFLTLVMQRYPNTVRIALSGRLDHSSNLKLLGTAHQVLSKPCSMERLKAALSLALARRDMLNSPELKKLVSQVQTLPSLPSCYLQLLDELRIDEPSIERVAQIISRDVGMCSKILHLVNSAFFGLPQKVINAEEAVTYLGTETLKSLVIYLHIFSFYERVPMEGFRFETVVDHCFRTGLIARRFARGRDSIPAQAEEAFVAGLLHDVGKLVLATGVPSKYRAALALRAEKKVPLEVAEREILGSSHSEVGAYLLSLWGLPLPVVDAVAWHHCPGDEPTAEFSPLTLVHVANALDHECYPDESGLPTATLDEAYLAGLNLIERLETWRVDVAEALGEA